MTARLVLLIAVGIVLISIWSVLVVSGTLHNCWQPPSAARGEPAAFAQAMRARIDQESSGNSAFVLLCSGQPCGSYFSSRGRPVESGTLFQVASVSKWITAWGVMTLVESGQIDLDTPVSRYLTRWSLPPAKFDTDGVTVRRLLSHTAGLTDGLGYGGFADQSDIQSLEDSLTGAADPMEGADGVVRVGQEPGASWRYSGGGYAILQLLIEETSGMPFDAYMRRTVLRPLGMSASGFDLTPAEEANLADFFDDDGTQAPHYRFTATGAASLYTSAADLTRFLQAHLEGPDGMPPGRGILQPATLETMRLPAAFQFGIPIWGLGVMLFAPTDSGGFIIGHDGHNVPAIRTTVRVDPDTGDGVIVLATGSGKLTGDIGAAWTYWQTGRVDLPTIAAGLSRMLAIWALGVVILLLALVFAAMKKAREA